MKSISNIQSFGKSRKTMIREATEQVIDVAYLAKESKGKGKIPRCDHCKKLGHEKKDS